MRVVSGPINLTPAWHVCFTRNYTGWTSLNEFSINWKWWFTSVYKTEPHSGDPTLPRIAAAVLLVGAVLLAVLLACGSSCAVLASAIGSLVACCLWPWLGPPLTALGYVMYFRFCGWRHTTGANGIILSLIHIWRCRRSTLCRSRWSPYH